MIYSYSKTVNAEKLDQEIKASGLSGLTGVTQVSPTLAQIGFSSTLSSGDKNTLDNLVAAHSPIYVEGIVAAKVQADVIFGQNLIKEWGVRVGVTGKTAQEIDSLLDNVDFLKIGMGMMTGAIAFCKEKIEAITPWSGFTQADKDWFLVKINEYLGAP